MIDGVDRLRDGAKIRRPTATPRASAGPPVANAPSPKAGPDGQPQGAPAEGQRRRQQANGAGGGTGGPNPGQPATQTNQ